MSWPINYIYAVFLCVVYPLTNVVFRYAKASVFVGTFFVLLQRDISNDVCLIEVMLAYMPSRGMYGVLQGGCGGGRRRATSGGATAAERVGPAPVTCRGEHRVQLPESTFRSYGEVYDDGSEDK